MVESINELRKKCQKEPRERIWLHDWYSVCFGWRVSIYFTKIFTMMKVSANQVTLLHLFAGFLAALFFIFGNYCYSIIGVLLMHLSLILDHVDGELARYWKKKSQKGKYLDFVAYDLPTSITFFTISLGAYYNSNRFLFFDSYHNPTTLVLGYVASAFWLLTTLASTREATVIVERRTVGVLKNVGEPRQVSDVEMKFRNLFFLIRLYPNIVTITSIFVILNLQSLFLILFSVIMPVIWIGSCYAMFSKLPMYA